MCNSITSASHAIKNELGSRVADGSSSSNRLPFIVPSLQRKITKLNYDLIEECKRCSEDSTLSKAIRDELEK